MTQPGHPVPGPQSYDSGTPDPGRKWLHDIPLAVRNPAHPLSAFVSSITCSTSTSSNLLTSNVEFRLSLRRSRDTSERSSSFASRLPELLFVRLTRFLSLAPNRRRYGVCNRRPAQ